jgi:hypothetical protein
MADTNNTEHLDFVYKLYEKMKKNNVNLAYEGEITHQITKAFTSLTETSMAKEEDYNSVQRKVFHVMVECLQNVSKHADRQDTIIPNKDGKGLFLVSKGDEEYSVTTGNLIKNEKIEPLKSMLENINKLDKDGLKKVYKRQIREGRLSEKEGAGLGFIDIARKTGEKLIYEFLPINDENSFFVLISTISRNKA